MSASFYGEELKDWTQSFLIVQIQDLDLIFPKAALHVHSPLKSCLDYEPESQVLFNPFFLYAFSPHLYFLKF